MRLPIPKGMLKVLRTRKEQLDLTNEQIAKIAGCDEMSVSRALRNQGSLENVSAVSVALGLPPLTIVFATSDQLRLERLSKRNPDMYRLVASLLDE